MSALSAFVVALVIVYVMPGPDMILLLETAASRGRAAALATAAGLALARSCHVAMAALGLTALFRAAPWTFDAVRLLGGAYLVWLGVRLFSAGGGSSVSTTPALAVGQADYAKAFRRGLLINLLNPKALIFCSVLLPQFIDVTHGAIGAQFLLLGVILVTIGLAFDVLYALAGSALGRCFDAAPLFARARNALFSTVLIALGAKLMLLEPLTR